jgi:23S rRNA pseudouridine1911/1915/1917 synthase
MKKIIYSENRKIRIDKFLASAFAKASADKQEFFSYTRGEIIRQIKEGNIIVNGKKIKPSYILKESDKLEINLKKSDTKLVPNKNIKPEIIYQDENIIVVNKPAGLQVHPDFHEKKNTLANALIVKFPEIKNVGDPSINSGQVNLRPGIVHRLDKDTSGVMVIARNQKTFLALKEKFKNRKVEKKYWAIVYEKLEKKEGVIDKPLARAASYRKQVVAGNRTKTTVREAVTHYKVLKVWKKYSLVELTPHTGRTHQIRVHLTSIGHPIVGDKIYKIKKIEEIAALRQMLHAANLAFELDGRKYDFKAKLPEDFREFTGNID